MYHERCLNMLANDDEAREYVEEKLERGWSPKQISGRARLEGKRFKLSYNTIYRAFVKGILKKGLKLCLRLKRVKNCKRRADDKRGKIPDTVQAHDSLYSESREASESISLCSFTTASVIGSVQTVVFTYS